MLPSPGHHLMRGFAADSSVTSRAQIICIQVVPVRRGVLITMSPGR
jgi:hypothetical protein